MEVPAILSATSGVAVASDRPVITIAAANVESLVSVSTFDSGSPREVIREIREKTRMARQMGFTGDPCPSCQAMQLVKNGTCNKCMSCGATTGCS